MWKSILAAIFLALCNTVPKAMAENVRCACNLNTMRDRQWIFVQHRPPPDWGDFGSAQANGTRAIAQMRYGQAPLVGQRRAMRPHIIYHNP
jgi:hypothetical protein